LIDEGVKNDVNAIKIRPIGLMLLDFQMPRKNGIEVI
jgi:hypothetical protein